MNDLLDKNKINSISQPILVSMSADEKCKWELLFVCVETGCGRINICGLEHNIHFSEVFKAWDADGFEINIEDLYL